MNVELSDFLERMPTIEGLDTQSCFDRLLDGDEPKLALYKDGNPLDDIRSSGYIALTELKKIGGKGNSFDIAKSGKWGLSGMMANMVCEELAKLMQYGVLDIEGQIPSDHPSGMDPTPPGEINILGPSSWQHTTFLLKDTTSYSVEYQSPK